MVRQLSKKLFSPKMQLLKSIILKELTPVGLIWLIELHNFFIFGNLIQSNTKKFVLIHFFNLKTKVCQVPQSSECVVNV